MSILIPGKLIFIGTPRTGSAAIAAALESLRDQRIDVRADPRQHIPASEIQTLGAVGGEYIFGTVRDPFDIMVTWFHKQTDYEDFATFLAKWNHKHLDSRGPLFRLVEDHHIIRYEMGLDQQVNKILTNVGLPTVMIPRVNVTDGKKPFRDYYDEHTLELVVNRFPNEILDYGYFPNWYWS